MNSDKRDFLIVLFGKIVQVLLMLATLKISTSLLSPSVMGQIYLFTTIYTFFVFLFISPIGQYFNRYTHLWEGEGTLYDRLWLYFIYMLIVSVCASIGATIIHFFGGSADFPLIHFTLLTGFFVLIVSANQTAVPLLNMLNFRGIFTILTFLTGFMALTLSVFFIFAVDKAASNWLLGILLGNALTLIIALLVLRKILIDKNKAFKIKLNFSCINKKNLYTLATFAIPVSFATVFMWAQNVGYRVSVESFLGLKYLGFLGIGLIIAAQISNVVEAILMQYLQPNFYRSIKGANFKERTNAVNFYLNITIPVYFSLALFLTFSIKFIFPVLVSSEYIDGYKFCIFGVWIEFIRMVTNSLSTIAHSEVKMKRYMYPYIFGALTTNILVYFAVKHVGEIDFVPISLIVGGIVTMLLMYLNMKNIMPFSLNISYLLIFTVTTIPSIIYFSNINFPKEIGVYYMFLLCVGGCIFVTSLASSFFIGRKIND